MKKLHFGKILLAGAFALSSMFAFSTAAQAEMSYNVGIHSKYLLRGIFEENSGAAIQGGADYSHDSGFYAGWWFSSLGYSYEKNGTDGSGSTNTDQDGKTNTSGFENDFYAGWSHEFKNGLGLSVGGIQYVYVNVDESDLLEAVATVSYADFYVGFQRLLTDGWWGNSGDTYWKAGYSFALPQDIGLALDYGYYTYEKSDNAQLGGKTASNQVTTSSSGFRHFNVTASKPLGKSGAEVYIQYTFAGEDRTKTDYNDSMVAGITYGF